MKIVSLIASATEIVCALGLQKQLVGRSHECDYPTSILKLPQCTETKFKTEGSSSDIDSRIKDIIRDGLSVYRVFEDKLKALQPDLIITQIQCEVCAVSEKDVRAAVCSWLENHPKIVSLNPSDLQGIWKDIQSVASAAGIPGEGTKLINQLKDRMAVIRDAVKDLNHRPTVACIEWIEPLMSAGNWMPELVNMAGGINSFGIAGKHSPTMAWNEFVNADPEFIFMMPCGWDIERTRSEMYFLTQRPEWPSLQAVKNHQVFLMDGNQYFNRPGPRIVESLEIIAEVLHPKIFDLGFKGRGWQPLQTS